MKSPWPLSFCPVSAVYRMPDSLRIWLPLIFSSAAIALALILWCAITFRNGRRHRSPLLGNSALVFFSTACTLIVIDLLFGSLFVQSDGFGFTLAAHRWNHKYWNPINAYGYRDHDHIWADHKLFVVGDSFAAGSGVETIDDRISEVLNRKLGPKWTVATIAKPGWDSAAEYAALAAHDVTPDIVVVSYFINDIDGPAGRHGHTPPMPRSPSNPFFRLLVENSFVMNWLYWRLSSEDINGQYLEYLKASYASEEVLEDHMAELEKFLVYADKTGARLYFLMWPGLTDVSGTEGFVRAVSGRLAKLGGRVIDLCPYFRGRAAGELVVSTFDSHPNPAIHAEVADIVYRRILADGSLEARLGP